MILQTMSRPQAINGPLLDGFLALLYPTLLALDSASAPLAPSFCKVLNISTIIIMLRLDG
jgi:hypothetical protein